LAALLFAISLTHGAQHSDPSIVDEAKREGKVAWYTTIAVAEGRQLINLFEKRYPFIQVDMLRTGAGPMINRVEKEYRAGSHIVDVIHGVSSRGVLPYFQEKGIITNYNSPERQYIADDLRDDNGYWYSLYALPYVLIYNTQLVKADDVPKVYEDLLQPKWKGKKILNDTENYAWFEGLLRHWGKDNGISYFRPVRGTSQ
jgi:ABC-type Fe3+ transport system substrate-binding protein